MIRMFSWGITTAVTHVVILGNSLQNVTFCVHAISNVFSYRSKATR